MKIHFSASSHDQALERLDTLVRLYGQSDLDDADYIVPLGGDGHMLHVLHDTMDRGLPVFGMNCGGVGFLTIITPALNCQNGFRPRKQRRSILCG